MNKIIHFLFVRTLAADVTCEASSPHRAALNMLSTERARINECIVCCQITVLLFIQSKHLFTCGLTLAELAELRTVCQTLLNIIAIIGKITQDLCRSHQLCQATHIELKDKEALGFQRQVQNYSI